MTDFDWQRSADAYALLDALFPQRGMDSTPEQPRKLRLYLTGICRANWDLLPPVCQAVVTLAEDMADHPAPHRTHWSLAREVAEAMTVAYGDPEAIAHATSRLASCGIPIDPDSGRSWTADSWQQACWMAFLPLWARVPNYRAVAPVYHRADLVRCIFGSPEPIDLDRRLGGRGRSDTTVQLARRMYATRTFDAMRLLADALREAGCTESVVLDHCQTEPHHSRGCWVVDWLLKK